MAKNPALKRSFSVVAHGKNTVELRQGVWNTVSFTLTDEGGSDKLFQVLSNLDGSRTPAQVAKEAGIKPAEVEALIDHLSSLDALEGVRRSALDYYLDEMVPALRPLMEEKPRHRRVILMGDAALVNAIEPLVKESIPEVTLEKPGPADPVRLAWEGVDGEDLLKGLELEQRAAILEQWGDALVVFAQKSPRPDRALTLNRLALTAGITWIHLALDGPFLFVGPTFEPHQGSCYECLDTRILMNVKNAETYQAYKNALVRREMKEGDLPILPALVGTAASHCALEICNYLVAGSNYTREQMLGIYLPTMTFSFHEVLKLPNCPACGASSEMDDQELYFDLRSMTGAAQ